MRHFNEQDEARFIVDNIKKALYEGINRSEIAVLYRSNSQSRVLEEAFIQENIPTGSMEDYVFLSEQKLKMLWLIFASSIIDMMTQLLNELSIHQLDVLGINLGSCSSNCT